MEQGPTEKAIYERHFRYKIPLPEALKNAPSLFPGNELYFNAFKWLSTCRASAMGIGCITYFMCVEYCNEHEIYDDQRQDFIVVIMAMDETFVEYSLKKSKVKAGPTEKPENDNG